jgi:CDP-diacylglycerol pyrophosphatase
MKVETDSLAHVDPFKLLARGLPSGKFFMGSQTLAVIAATFADGRIGFYLLAKTIRIVGFQTHAYPGNLNTFKSVF